MNRSELVDYLKINGYVVKNKKKKYYQYIFRSCFGTKLFIGRIIPYIGKWEELGNGYDTIRYDEESDKFQIANIGLHGNRWSSIMIDESVHIFTNIDEVNTFVLENNEK